MNRRIFLKTTGASTALMLTPPLLRAAANVGPSDSEILADAKDGIAKHRQGDSVVTVRVRIQPKPALVRISPESEVPILNR